VLEAASPREAYLRIRNFLAGRVLGATRDEALVEELIKCLFCRASLLEGDGVNARGDLPRRGPGELGAAYRAAFVQLRGRMPGVFEADAALELDDEALAYVDAQLEGLDFRSPDGDPIGEAYEVFVGSAARAAQGQFFTPQNAVQLLVELVAPQPGERLVDPACGAGGFLSFAARELLARGAGPEQLAASLYGVDKDRYLARLARAHLGLLTLAEAKVECGDSLAWRAETGAPLERELGSFDVVLTNPPFGAKIVAASEEVRAGFELAHRHRRRGSGFVKTDRLQRSSSPQILFLERCLSLARPGGRLGLIVPESLVSSPGYRYAIDHMRARAEILAVIGMPENLFKSSGRGGTHTKTCALVLRRRGAGEGERAPVRVFMAEAKWCGHDSRGRAIERDDLPEIARRYRAFRASARDESASELEQGQLGYGLAPAQIRDHVLSPRYYDPEIARELARLSRTHALTRIADLEQAGAIEIKTGDEVGKLAYGTGDVPFVRTSDISNWEIKLDPKHCVSEEIYAQLAAKQDVREGDVLMVRDGTYLIGTCAYVSKYDTRILFQSHLYKLRVEGHELLTPELLLALLSSAPVRRQIQAKRFTQDIIDSLGDRVRELVLPIPREASKRERISKLVRRVIRDRIEARELARLAVLEVVD
jgi:type I restriction enzyme M protein